jgi:hypothetical protein
MLLRFSGFGPVALSIFPDPVTGHYKDATWKAFGEELKALLTRDEYASAKRTTFNAFYTSPTVIQAMHGAITRLGVPASAAVLEPGCGIGNFMTYAPNEMRFIGVEMDIVSGRIAKVLHPNQDVRIENFRDTKLHEGSLDAVLGNVPFADLKLEYRGQKFSLHDFFFAKAIDALCPGGILALVTSRFTLDKQNGAIREYLAARADFVGAIRLPSDAFKLEGTQVVTDIIFLRKRKADEPPCHVGPDWMTVDSVSVEGGDVVLNRYFKNFPDMILGTLTRKDTLYGEGFSVRGDGDLERKLEEAIERLPEYGALSTPADEPKPPITPLARPPPDQNLSDGSFVVTEGGAISQLIGGRIEPVIYGGRKLHANGAMTGRRLASLIRLRDLARLVLLSQNEGWPEADREKARRELNVAYDRFLNLYGPINKTTFGETEGGGHIRRMPNLVKFREDPDAMLVMSLEEYDEVTGRSLKSAIMKKDVVGKIPPVTRVNTAEEGLLVSLNLRGVVDLPFISELYGKAENDVAAELGRLIFLDPELKSWQTADAYLSGNVRAKLKAAEGAGPAFLRNVEALKDVQPEDVLPGEIDANLGAPWIPEIDIQAFASDLFKVEPSSVPVAHLPKDALEP